MSLSLTYNEAKYIKDKILSSPYCRDTLLTFLIEKGNLTLTDEESYYDLASHLDGLDAEVRDVYDKSVLFSKLIHLIDWSYNHAYYNSFGYNDAADECKIAFEKLYETHKMTLLDRSAYRSLFDYTNVIDPLLTEFCENCYDVIVCEGIASLERLDSLVTSREQTVKRERSKIGNSSYSTVKRMSPGYNEFRWTQVRTMINEIRNPQ
jgi:hypothetical protein